MMDQVTHFLFLAALILVIVFILILLSSMSCFKGWMKKEDQKLSNFYNKVSAKADTISGKIQAATCKTCNGVNKNLCTPDDPASGWKGLYTTGTTACVKGQSDNKLSATDQLWFNSTCMEGDKFLYTIDANTDCASYITDDE
jgi:hypothetical protein